MIKWVGKRNGKAGSCANCLQGVEANTGLLCIDESRGRWLVFHLTCAPPEIQAQVAGRTQQASVPTSLQLDVREGKSGAEVMIRQGGGRMSNDQFSKFRGVTADCCRNEKQKDGSWVAVAPIDRAAGIQESLEAAGFRVDPTPMLMERLASTAHVAATVTAMAAERAARVNEILAARGLYLYPFQSAGVQWLAPRNKALLADAMGLGKGHPVDTKILLPDGGFKAIGDLEVGERVVGRLGLPVAVLGVYRRGVLPLYRVSFRDGASVLVDGDHLWSVSNDQGETCVMPTRLLRHAVKDGSPFWIPVLPHLAYGFRLVERIVSAVEPEGEGEVVCIAVDAPDKLYVVTEHLIVTHNTVQASTAFADNAPVVVICPAVVKANWAEELARWRPERAPAVILEGRGSMTRWPQAGETFILNFAILPEELAALGAPAPGTYLIADEAQNLKTLRTLSDGSPDPKKSSQQALRFYNMRTAAFAVAGAVWLLTGTPIMNRAAELWSVLQQADLARDAFGSWKNYTAAWNATPGAYGGLDWGYPDEEVIGDRLRRVMLRREKTEVLVDLPPKTYQSIVVPIDDVSRTELSRYSDSISASLHGEMAVGFDPVQALETIAARDREAELEAQEGSGAEKLTEKERLLLQSSEATDFEQLSRAREALARAKLPALMALVDQHEQTEPTEPLIVFSAHLEPLRALARRPGWILLDGSVSAKKRGEIVKRFQAGQIRGLAASIKASGVGITLTRANRAVFLDKDWTPANNLQAEDRIYRIGQFRPTTIVSLVAEHPIDELIAANLEWKERIIRGSIMAGKRGPTEIVAEPVRMVHQAPPVAPPPAFDPVAAGFALGPLNPEKVRAEYLRRLQQEEIEEEIRVRQGRKQTREERAKARLKPTEEQLARTDRRGPRSELEEWAATGIVQLTGLDADFAFEENYVGWSKSSTTAGHQFAALLLGSGGLTDDEWQEAVALVRPYQGQVGPPPGVDPDAVRTRKRTVKKLASDTFAPGERVMTPDGPGAVVEKYARTYAVRLDSGQLWKGGAAKLLRDSPGGEQVAQALSPADLADLESAMGAPPPGPAPEYNPYGGSRRPPWYW